MGRLTFTKFRQSRDVLKTYEKGTVLDTVDGESDFEILIEEKCLYPLNHPKYHPDINKSAITGGEIFSNKKLWGLASLSNERLDSFLVSESISIRSINNGAYFHVGSHSGCTFTGKFEENSVTVFADSIIDRPLSRDPSYPGVSTSASYTHKISGAEDVILRDGEWIASGITNDNFSLTIENVETVKINEACFVVSPYAKLYPWDRITSTILRVAYLKNVVSTELFESLVFLFDEHLSEYDLRELRYMGVKRYCPMKSATLVLCDRLIDLPQIKLNSIFPSFLSRQYLRSEFISSVRSVNVSSGRYYLPRPPYPHWRSVLNQEDLTNVFINFGFEVLTTERLNSLPLNELATLLWNAEVVASHSGSSAVNSIFCKGKFLSCIAVSCPLTEQYSAPSTISDTDHHIVFSEYDVRTSLNREQQPFSHFNCSEVERVLSRLIGSG